MVEEQVDCKRKRQYYPKKDGGHQKRQRRFDLRQNGRGILVTSGSPNYTKDSVREAMNILKLEVHEPEIEIQSATDICAAVNLELNQLKEDAERFIPIKDLTKGVSFLQFTLPEDHPNELVFSILDNIPPLNPLSVDKKEASKEQQEVGENNRRTSEVKQPKETKISCRFVNRLIPIEITCPPHLENFKRTVRLLIEAYFPESEVKLHPEKFEDSINQDVEECDPPKKPTEKEESKSEVVKVESRVKSFDPQNRLHAAFVVPKGASWSIQFERRAGMKTLDRDMVINEIGRMVGNDYTVNLTKPEYTVIIELNNTFCGMSVVRDFTRLLRYNIHRLCHAEDNEPCCKESRKESRKN